MRKYKLLQKYTFVIVNYEEKIVDITFYQIPNND